MTLIFEITTNILVFLVFKNFVFDHKHKYVWYYVLKYMEIKVNADVY